MRQEILDKIKKSTTQVNLMSMEIADNEIDEIMDVILNEKPNTSEFYLDNNTISDEGACILSEALSKFNNITALSIQFNNIGREGAISLFQIKSNFPDIDILFHGNKITNVAEMDEIEKLATEQTYRSSM